MSKDEVGNEKMFFASSFINFWGLGHRVGPHGQKQDNVHIWIKRKHCSLIDNKK